MPNCPKLNKYKTINFKTKTYEDIFLEELNDSFTEGLLSSNKKFMDYIENNEDIENNYVMQCSIHSKNLEKCYNELKNIYDSYDIYNATGDDLARIGLLYGFEKPTAQPSFVDLTFTITPTPTIDVTIPERTIVSTNSTEGIFYYTIEKGKISSGTNTITIPSKSVATGLQSKVAKDELTYIQTNFQNQVTGTITVTNPYSATGGEEAITDDEFREVILTWNKILKRGTKAAYINYLDNCEEVDGYTIIPCWDGTGTIKIIIDPNSTYVLEKVANEIFDNVQMFDDDVLIEGAVEVNVDVDLTVNITLDTLTEYTTDEREVIKTNIKNLVKLYINGGKICDTEYTKGLGIGENFIPFQCGVFLTNHVSEIKNINFNIPSNIKDTVAETSYGIVDDEEMAVCGTVNVNIE